MNILFSLPWIHTNNSGMVEGLIRNGHQVCFITMSKKQHNYIPHGLESHIYYFLPKKNSLYRINGQNSFMRKSLKESDKLLTKKNLI
jgi:hypothetical protein